MNDDVYTPQRLIKEMNAGIKEFGRYAFFDKGAREVMDLGPVVEWLHTKSPEFVGEFLKELIGPRARPPLNRMHLAGGLLEELNGPGCPWTQEQWDRLEERYNGKGQ